MRNPLIAPGQKFNLPDFPAIEPAHVMVALLDQQGGTVRGLPDQG